MVSLSLTALGLIIAISVLAIIFVFREQIWSLFRSEENVTIRDTLVPESNPAYFIGQELVGQIIRYEGPDQQRPNPRKKISDKHFFVVVRTMDGQSSREEVWSNEMWPMNMACYANAPGATWMKLAEDPTEEQIREMQAHIFALKHELNQNRDERWNMFKKDLNDVKEAIDKFMPKVVYQPKGKGGSGGAPPGGEQSGTE